MEITSYLRRTSSPTPQHIFTTESLEKNWKKIRPLAQNSLIFNQNMQRSLHSRPPYSTNMAQMEGSATILGGRLVFRYLELFRLVWRRLLPPCACDRICAALAAARAFCAALALTFALASFAFDDGDGRGTHCPSLQELSGGQHSW